MSFYDRYIKRLLDIALSGGALIVLWPVLLILAVLVHTKLGSPVIFCQERPGKDEKIFKLYKFRSMTDERDADGHLLSDEVRLTKFGKLLRSTSLDELPELWNILRGDMSIVGPRPLPVYETEAFPKIEHRRRLSVKPGLTCYWQIEDRSDNGDFDNMVNKDLRYIDEWSLWLDIKLFFRTIPAVLFGKGAK